MKMMLGLAVIALGIFLEFMWFGFCFGSIIIGILLLIFAPSIMNPFFKTSKSSFLIPPLYDTSGNSFTPLVSKLLSA
jgi:hypothetical protein